MEGETASSSRSLCITFSVTMGIIVVSVFVVPLSIGIWLPDVLMGRVCTLAEVRSSTGHSFRVVQYWNHGDFYNTELIHTAPDGTATNFVLDGDDAKSWRVPLTLDEPTRTATAILGGGRVKEVRW